MLTRVSKHAGPRLFRRFWAARDGVSAIEFSIWAPVMTALFLGGVDTARYTIATGRIADVASTIGQMLSVNTSGTVNYIDLQFYDDSAMAIYPQVLADAARQGIAWGNDMAITISQVNFTATPTGCTTSCSYQAKVAWTAGSNKRSCLVAPSSASDTAAPSSSTLPADAFGPTSQIVVDVSFTFRPLFAAFILKSTVIRRSFYISPRYVTTIAYQTISGDPGTTTVCP
jgi:Flp pilus assembly protein TadG